MKILVVDSEIQILHVISMKLRAGNYKVLATQDGLDALDMAQVEKPDAIICACRIYRSSGLELCNQLQAIPATQNIPKLLLTSRGYSLDPASIEAAGIDVVLNKPNNWSNYIAKYGAIAITYLFTNFIPFD